MPRVEPCRRITVLDRKADPLNPAGAGHLRYSAQEPITDTLTAVFGTDPDAQLWHSVCDEPVGPPPLLGPLGM